MRLEKSDMVFYLKINRNNTYVITNFKHWLSATMLYENSLIYVICDNLELKAKIEKEVSIDYDRVEFIESDRNCNEINYILKNICSCNKWIRVGQAHMKAHWHACEYGYEKFWNIDADDTFICLDPIRIVDVFKCVENYSEEHSIALNGLDMWRSMSIAEKWAKGDNWSLGITYVDNSIDWKKIMLEYCAGYKEELGISDHDKEVNLDWFFTYLKNKKLASIETFYFENMKFMHFYDYFINYPHLSMFCQWKDGVISYPILEHCFGTHTISKLKIADDIHKFDIGIGEDEGLYSLIACSGERKVFYSDLHNQKLDVGDVMRKRNELLLKQTNTKEMICWGCGECFNRNIELIKKAYDLKYVCDNDSSKWGKKIYEDIECISPDELKARNNVYVLILIDSVATNYRIVHQLIEMGIYNFEHFDNWLEFVEGEC